MKVQGFLHKEKGGWAVEMPLLLIFTQGHTKKNAYAMAKDAVESLVEKDGFAVKIHPGEGNDFTLSANDDQALMAFILKQRRAVSGLTVREVAKRLGSNSPRAYSKYEEGATKPSLEKFSELMQAIDAHADLVLNVVKKRTA